MKIAREGWPLIIPICLLTMLAGGLSWLLSPIAAAIVLVAGGALTLWAVWFFRDPDRQSPSIPGVVLSPADGVVIRVDRAPLPVEVRETEDEAGHAMERIAIFLNLFNVHVNRVPCSGKIIRTAYVPGKFFNASLDKASTDNERSAAVMLVDPRSPLSPSGGGGGGGTGPADGVVEGGGGGRKHRRAQSGKSVARHGGQQRRDDGVPRTDTARR